MADVHVPKIASRPIAGDDGKTLVYDADADAHVYAPLPEGGGGGEGGASSFSELSGDPGDNAALAAALAAKASADSIPTWGSIGGKPAVVAAGATAAAARDAIGAGVSNLQIGTGVNDAAAGDRAATESMTGMVERATEGEVLAGTDTTRYVSPAGLAAALDARGSGFTWWDGTGDEPEGPDGEFVVTPA